MAPGIAAAAAAAGRRGVSTLVEIGGTRWGKATGRRAFTAVAGSALRNDRFCTSAQGRGVAAAGACGGGAAADGAGRLGTIRVCRQQLSSFSTQGQGRKKRKRRKKWSVPKEEPPLTKEQEEIAKHPHAVKRRGVWRIGVHKPARTAYMHGRKETIEELDRRARDKALPWKWQTAVLVERWPIITPDHEPWEEEMMDLRLKQLALGGRAYPDSISIMDNDTPPISMKEALAMCPVPLAPRVTAADDADDRTSLNRALSEPLVLIVRPQDRKGGFAGVGEAAPKGEGWQLPHSSLDVSTHASSEETSRKAAERALEAFFTEPPTPDGTKVETFDPYEVNLIGNAPAGYHWAEYPAEQQAEEKMFGHKTFFHRCELVAGVPKLLPHFTEHQWIKKSEFKDYFPPDMADFLEKVAP